jgi:Zn-dependent protease with chaperone function
LIRARDVHVPSTLDPAPAVSYGGFISSFYVISYEQMRWKWEFKADYFAGEKTDPESAISFLTKIASSIDGDCDSPTHPSIKRRLSRLKTASHQ